MNTELIKQHNHPELAEEQGMVRQVWGDGEVTLQKSGELLGQRSLHQVAPPITPEKYAMTLPDGEQENEHGYVENPDKTYIFTDEAGAIAIRKEILSYWVYMCEIHNK